MENTLEFGSTSVQQISSLLHFLNAFGTQPSWIYWNRKTLKLLTKEGYIDFDRKTHYVTITVKGELWIKEHPQTKEIDIVKWMKEKSFCRLQRLITQRKCFKLIHHLSNANRLYELHDLFLKIRERKHKIWTNRIVRNKVAQRSGIHNTQFKLGQSTDYLVLEVEARGPYQIRANLLDLHRNYFIQVDDLPLYEACQFISSEKATCLKVLALPR
jgi:hypothetical protein